MSMTDCTSSGNECSICIIRVANGCLAPILRSGNDEC
jgi:hypothetical protein